MTDSQSLSEQQLFLPPSVVHFINTNFGSIANIEIKKSAQQQVYVIKTATHQSLCLVLRVWKGACNWWNFHQPNSNDAISLLARSEVAGYKVARHCLPNLHIPRVIHFNQQEAWALLEYIDHTSTGNNDDDNILDNSWTLSLVTERYEFGFVEPHPRWGRVPADLALDYAMLVLESVIIPLHEQTRNMTNHATLEGIEGLFGYSHITGYTFEHVLQQCTKTYQNLYTINNKNNSASSDKSLALSQVLQKMHASIQNLRSAVERNNSVLTPLQPVLCHMDCQPQNLLFVKNKGNNTGNVSDKNDNSKRSEVLSVLDFEESAYADPRFEVLLLCRKVCANLDQAYIIWNKYATVRKLTLGPIEYWLTLESLVSLSILLMQLMHSMDIITTTTTNGTIGNNNNRGRSPWETKSDLWQKINREHQRLLMWKINTVETTC